jgi:glyoxylase-like metal-dependent hydrolase (beta-lactamase superfamily II)
MIIRWIIAVLLLNTPTPPDQPEFFEIADDLYYRQLDEGVYIITHEFPWPANALLVEMDSGDLVLVDTPYTPEATEALLDWIEYTFGERPITAINTGYHVDNLGGNSALIEAGIPVYGSDKTAELLDEKGEDTRAYLLKWLSGPQNKRFYEAHAAIPYIPPDQLFPLEDGLDLQFGDQNVQVYYPGPSHTLDNIVVYFPDRKILFGGCMILAGDTIGNAEDADLEAWPKSVRKLERFEIEVLVPGHGDRFDLGLLNHTIDVLEAG